MGSSSEFYKVAAENYYKAERVFIKYHDMIQNKPLVKFVSTCAAGYVWVNYAVSTVEADLKAFKAAFPKVVEDVGGLVSQMSEANRDLHDLKTEVKDLREDHLELKKTIYDLKNALLVFQKQPPIPSERARLLSYMCQQQVCLDAWRKMRQV